MAKNVQKVSDIKVLKGTDAVRKRPGMYLGETAFFLINAFREVLDNCVDEYWYDRNDEIFISIDTKKDLYTVADKGTGIPVEIHPETKMSTLTTIFTTLHAGGKFDKSVGRGMHGLGVSCTNAISDYFKVWTNRNNIWYSQEFSKGKPTTDVEKDRPPFKWPCGTIVQFRPDFTIVKKGSKIKRKEFDELIYDLPYLCPGLKISFEFDGDTDKLFSKKGAADLVGSYLEEEGLDKNGKAFEYSDDKLDVYLQWSNADFEEVWCYTNSIYNSEGGSHYQGLKKVITNVLSAYKKKSISGDDLRTGLIGLVHVKHLSDPAYSTQTKEKLTTEHVETDIYNTLKPKLEQFFTDNNALALRIVKAAEHIKAAREKSKAEIQAIQKASKKTKKKGVLPGILDEAPKCDPAKRELFVTEGESASGTARQARDASFQEILPLRGKVINAVKQAASSVFNNKEIQYIIAALGYDVKNGATNSLRVGKFIIMCDADPDGFQIAALILGFLAKYTPSIINDGVVYVTELPLYACQHGGNKYYGDTLQDIQKQLPKGTKNPIIIRQKGLGEMAAKDLQELAFNPKTRRLKQITSTKQCYKLIENVMGKEVAYRKKMFGV